MKTSTVKKLTRAALLAVLACALPALAAQDNVGLGNGTDGALEVSGPQTLINDYALVTWGLKPGATTLEVDDAKGFGPDDLVMVLQSTGSDPASLAAPVEAPSVPLDSNGVGRWEFARLQAVDGTTLRLTAPLVHEYLGDHTQVIRVPEYTSVNILPGASLVPEPWNGTTGGVLAFLVQGTLTIESRPTLAASDTDVAISAVGRGFQGGQWSQPDSSGALFCSELERTSPGGAQKGEGITALRYGKDQTGRGRVANAGGGGVCVKAGGGGGGNGGMGGTGGNSYADEGGLGRGNRPVGGQGGAKLTYTPDFPGDRLLMGGGGGMGHSTRDFRWSGMQGGNGGGILFIRAHTLLGSGLIQANGAPGGGTSYADSGSGGGAGGTLYLRITGQAECSPPQAQGGKGGDASSRSGPGGGGAGGRIILQKGSGSCGVDDLSVSGVNPGTQPDPANPSYGATRGGNGTVTLLQGGFSAQALPAPVVVAPGNGAHVNTPTPAYSGTLSVTPALPTGTRVSVYVDGREVGSTTVDSAGGWSLHPTAPDDVLSPGVHTVYAVAEDAEQGVASAPSSTHTFTVDLAAPAVAVTTPAEGSQTHDTTPGYTGTVSDDGPGPLTVTVRVDGGPPVPATVTGDTWSYTPAAPLASGPHTVTVIATDPAGNTSTDSNTFTVQDNTPPTVQVLTPAEGSQSANTQPEYTGTASDDGPGPLAVTVSVDGGPPVPATVTGDTWSHTPTAPLEPGPHTVTVIVTDAEGNTSTDSNTFTVEPPQGLAPTPAQPLAQPEVDRDFLGGGMGCASAGGQPAALAMLGAVLSALLARRRRR